MTIIWVVRHGQASFGNADYDVLSETGKVQSEITGRFFKNTGVDFDFLYSGNMKRQIDTAKYTVKTLGCEIEPIVNSSFDEYDFSSIIKSQLPGIIDVEPSTADEVRDIFKDNISFQRVFGKIMKRWISGKYDEEGVETYIEYKKRVKGGLFKISEENDKESTIALFTSGGVISIAMQLALNLSDHEAMRLGWQIRNASISKFKISNGRLNLLMFNQMAHIECEAMPELLTYR